MAVLSPVSFAWPAGALLLLCSCSGQTQHAAAVDAGHATPGDSGKVTTTVLDAGHTPARCSGAVHTTGSSASSLPAAPAVTLPSGFKLEVIANLTEPRELVVLPNGDLLVGTRGANVYVVPNAESTGVADVPVLFASIQDTPVQGVAFLAATCTIAVATQHGLYTFPYVDGQTTGTPGAPIAMFRKGPTAHSVDASVDTDTHVTSSVAYAGGKIYVGVGSSCSACVEVDPTRATVQEMNLDGSGMTTKATRIRNAIAVTENPMTGTVWAGGAGQDALALGHPYEFFDAVTSHAGLTDYGWPDCEENQHAYVAGSSCGETVEPLIELPAYSTVIGAAFYPVGVTGAYAFPKSYAGGLFLTAHGSWHTVSGGAYYSPPRVAYVAMNGDVPVTPVDWNDPTKQWVEFVGGFQLADGTTRIGRPTGAAVGPLGSLFIADDQTGDVYRIRPL